jgi:hypothetical protein
VGVLLVRGGQLQPDFLARGDWRDWFLPGLGTADFADVADAGKLPQALLPQPNFGREGIRLIRFRRSPMSPDRIEEQRRLLIMQRLPQNPEILRIELPLLRDGFDGLAAIRQSVTFGQGSG